MNVSFTFGRFHEVKVPADITDFEEGFYKQA